MQLGPRGCKPAANSFELLFRRAGLEEVGGCGAVPCFELSEHPVDDVRRRAPVVKMRVGALLEACLAEDVVRFDLFDRDANESEQEPSEHASPILSARAMEEDAAIRLRQDGDNLGETRSVEIERLAVEQPMLLRVVEVRRASERVARSARRIRKAAAASDIAAKAARVTSSGPGVSRS